MLCRAARPAMGMLLLSTQLLACTEWSTETMSARNLIESSHPSRIRVTRTDGTHVVLNQPVLQSDTLVGQVKGSRSAVPVADVTGVAVRRTNTVNTVLLIGGLIFITAAVAAAASSYGGSFGTQ